MTVLCGPKERALLWQSTTVDFELRFEVVPGTKAVRIAQEHFGSSALRLVSCMKPDHGCSNVGVLFLLFLGATIAPWATIHTADAHDWYPVECCHRMDCAPVDKVEVLTPASANAPPTMVITTEHGSVVVPPDFPRRESHDNRMHACIRQGATGRMHLLCFFLPPPS